MQVGTLYTTAMLEFDVSGRATRILIPVDSMGPCQQVVGGSTALGLVTDGIQASDPDVLGPGSMQHVGAGAPAVRDELMTGDARRRTERRVRWGGVGVMVLGGSASAVAGFWLTMSGTSLWMTASVLGYGFFVLGVFVLVVGREYLRAVGPEEGFDAPGVRTRREIHRYPVVHYSDVRVTSDLPQWSVARMWLGGALVCGTIGWLSVVLGVSYGSYLVPLGLSMACVGLVHLLGGWRPLDDARWMDGDGATGAKPSPDLPVDTVRAADVAEAAPDMGSEATAGRKTSSLEPSPFVDALPWVDLVPSGSSRGTKSTGDDVDSSLRVLRCWFLLWFRVCGRAWALTGSVGVVLGLVLMMLPGAEANMAGIVVTVVGSGMGSGGGVLYMLHDLLTTPHARWV